MSKVILAICLFVVAAACLAQTASHEGSSEAITFGGRQFIHRWSQNTQHEYTPAKEEDLNRWADMVTINGYPQAVDGESLARITNAVLSNYKRAKAAIVKNGSVPKTDQQPEEHLIIASFTQPTFSEAAFARFRLHDGVGQSVAYSHRIYGKGTGAQMSAWLKKNGAATEKQLKTFP